MTQLLTPGTEMDHRELCRRTRQAIQKSTYTQRAVAEALGVDESSVSRACNEPGSTFQHLQRRIIEEVTGLCVEKHVRFVVQENT
jgi:predicted XRE-type DNA-binding protein